MLNLKNIITKIYNYCIGNYTIINSSTEQYVPYTQDYINKKMLKLYNVKKHFGYILVQDTKDDKVYNLKKNFNDYIKGEKYLFRKWDNTTRIATCIAVSKNLPPIFDGHETPGIGYDIIGQLIN